MGFTFFFTDKERDFLRSNAKKYFSQTTADPLCTFLASLIPKYVGPNYITLAVGPLAAVAKQSAIKFTGNKYLGWGAFAIAYLVGQRTSDLFALRIRTTTGTGSVLAEVTALYTATAVSNLPGANNITRCVPSLLTVLGVPRGLMVSLTAAVFAVAGNDSAVDSLVPAWAPNAVCSALSVVYQKDIVSGLGYVLQIGQPNLIRAAMLPLLTRLARLTNSNRGTHPLCLAPLPLRLPVVPGTIASAFAVLEVALQERGNGFFPHVRVYIDGVYDLCHVGHKRVMERAASHGTFLVCGVMSDEDTEKYKRKPIMTTAERCAEVLGCKYADEVIPGAPATGLTLEFLLENDIHLVCYGEEYEVPKDHKDYRYYGVPRELGIAQTLPRTGGISTSDLISRIQARSAKDTAAKDAKK